MLALWTTRRVFSREGEPHWSRSFPVSQQNSKPFRQMHPTGMGRNHGWKVWGTKVWVPNTGALFARPKAGMGIWCGIGSLPPTVRVRSITLGKFVKTQMLNPAFWWLLCLLVGSLGRVYPSKQQYLLWNFLLFENWAKKFGGPIHCWFPQPKSRGPVSPGPYGCCSYAYGHDKIGKKTFCISMIAYS